MKYRTIHEEHWKGTFYATVECSNCGQQLRDTQRRHAPAYCPHCGHNLCIDYRGAGLQINCSECDEPVLVPIPDGMKISDLDLDSAELLKQLFATRRLLQRAEARAEALEIKLGDVAGKIAELQETLGK